MKRGSRQLRFRLSERPTHGGRRPGAGRKPKGERAGVSHHGRPKVVRSTPAHVTLKVLRHVWNLRSVRSLRVVGAALEGARRGETFRVVHFSAQGDHRHLVACTDADPSAPFARSAPPPRRRLPPAASSGPTFQPQPARGIDPPTARPRPPSPRSSPAPHVADPPPLG